MFETARFHAPRCDWLAGSWRRSRKVGGKQCRRLPQETTDGVVSGASHPRSDQFALAATHYHLEERQGSRNPVLQPERLSAREEKVAARTEKATRR